MIISEISSDDALNIRQAVLRPDGTTLDCVFPGDNALSTKHFGGFLNDKLVAIASIYKRDHSAHDGIGYQIRAMATLPHARGKGIGTRLLAKAESDAFIRGADYLWANARIEAKLFYRNAGYLINDNEYLIEGVGLHVLATKDRRQQ